MTLRVAPRVLGGRFERKDARTAPVLPWTSVSIASLFDRIASDISTVCSSDLAPYASDLGASDFLLCSVDVHNFLAKVEANAC